MPFITIVIPKGFEDPELRDTEAKVKDIISDALEVNLSDVLIVFVENPLTDGGPVNVLVTIKCKKTTKRTDDLKDEVALILAYAVREKLLQNGVKVMCEFEELGRFKETKRYCGSD